MDDNDIEFFSINNGKEKFEINNNCFLYEKKEDNLKYNSHVVRITPLYISFYEKNNINNDSYNTFHIKIERDFSYMKLSETYKSDNILKKDIYTCLIDGKDTIKEVNRKYDKDGNLIESIVNYEDLFITTEEYIKNQLINSLEVKKLYNRINEFDSSISSLLSDINPDYNYLIDSYNKNKVLKK